MAELARRGQRHPAADTDRGAGSRGANRRGITRDDLTNAITQRDAKPGPGRRYLGTAHRRGRPGGGGVAALPVEWTPRELRHSFVSLVWANGASIELIARLGPATPPRRRQSRSTATSCAPSSPREPTSSAGPFGRDHPRPGTDRRPFRRPNIERGLIPVRYGASELVGVAGFEPAASSSRIRPWKADNLWTLPKMQVRALVCVGLAWCSEAAISRSSPGFLHRPSSHTGQHDRPPVPGQHLSVCHNTDAAVGVAVRILHGGEHPFFEDHPVSGARGAGLPRRRHPVSGHDPAITSAIVPGTRTPSLSPA
jgi:hypothetical protein